MLKWYAMRTLLKVYSNLKPAFPHAFEPPSRLENYLHYLVVEQVCKKHCRNSINYTKFKICSANAEGKDFVSICFYKSC